METISLRYPRVSNIVPILATFLSLSRKFERGYCFPSQARIVDLSARFYQVLFSRRTLNRWLFVLEEAGYIKRIRRHKRIPTGGIRFASTVYILLKPAYVLLSRFSSSLYSAGVRITNRLRDKFARSRERVTVDRAPCAKLQRFEIPEEVRKFISSL